MKKYTSVYASVLVTAAFLVLPTLALADTVGPINFENPPYVAGSISGQQGWSNAVNPAYDQAVVVNAGAPASFGAQSFRISDAVTSGSFGDWVFSKPLTNSVGETSATAGPYSAGTKQAHFEMSFDIVSTQAEQQPGLHISVSPDRGDGSRMSYLRFEDGANGINVFFDDVQGTSNPANFVETQIASGLSRTTPHTVKLTMDVVDGASNDVVNVYIDGVLVHTGTSWENYYRYDTEAAAEPTPRIVDDMLIQARGTATPADLGKGFLFDNVSLLSGPIPTPPPSTVSVHIFKYIDGKPATATNANNAAFPMQTSFTSSNLGSATNAPFTLSPTGWGGTDGPYEASFSNSNPGANYAANEVTGGSVVGADCTTGQPFAFSGYSTSTTLAAAAAAVTTTASPSFTNLQSDEYVVVWNKYCLPTPAITTPANGSTVTTAAMTEVDWTAVTDPAGGITYTYAVSNASTTNPDGSFTSTVYSQAGLTSPTIPTPGTAPGVYYLQVQAKDADGNTSAWSPTVMVTVSNTVTPPPTTLQVHVLKYLDGAKAVSVPGNYLFPMTATWDTANLNGGVSTSGTYTLGSSWGGAANLYGADTAAMQAPADYATNEITNDVDATSKVLPIDGTCVPGDYQLVGYTASSTAFDTNPADATPTAPSFSQVSTDQYVVVFNKTCPTTGSLTIQKNSIGGLSTFKFSGDGGIGSFSITTTGSKTGGAGTSQTFSNLTPGTYHITETTQNGWTMTDNECAAAVVAAGDPVVCIVTNTNNKLLGEIRGTKYEDIDGDGTLKDGDHHRIAGVTIYLDTNNNGVLDSGEPTAITDSHGNYDFVGLAAGTYHVREVVPTGWKETVPASGSYTIVLTAGQVAKNKNFGDFKFGTISGMKFNDLNGNGRKDKNEVGIQGITINLKGPHGFTASTVTDASGNYTFGNLGSGIYMLSEVVPKGWNQTAHPWPVRILSGTNSKNDNFGNTQHSKNRYGGFWGN